MSSMVKFFNDVVTGLGAGQVGCHFNSDSNRLRSVLIFKAPFNGARACVNSRIITITPAKDKAHCIDIEEIWDGKDAEGYPWSDHMGGIRIDCTGLKFKEAVDKIVNRIKNEYKDLLENGIK